MFRMLFLNFLESKCLSAKYLSNIYIFYTNANIQPPNDSWDLVAKYSLSVPIKNIFYTIKNY